MFEIEKRSLLKDEVEFDKVKADVERKAKFLGRKEFKSFLFKGPTHLRIRLIKGSNNVLITEKEGEYADSARKETEKEIPYDSLKKYLKEITKKGYKECSMVNTERFSYDFEELKIELNKIDYLGLIVEIEALTEDSDQIPIFEEKIRDVMGRLNLEELDPKEYTIMMKDMKRKTLKKTSEQNFQI